MLSSISILVMVSLFRAIQQELTKCLTSVPKVRKEQHSQSWHLGQLAIHIREKNDVELLLRTYLKLTLHG